MSKPINRLRSTGDRLRWIWSCLGPGVISGAADDDPSGIATYSIAGAQLGTTFLWLAPVTWPLMAAVQGMSARIGMVTGRGLMAALRKKLPRPALIFICFGLLAANTINIGADLAGMADAADMLSGLPSRLWVVLFGGLLAWGVVQFRYAAMARTLKWLALVLFAYMITAIKLGPDWGSVLHDTLLPAIPAGSAGWATLVAILGTTISPYLFFWQASEEVEEEKAIGRRTAGARHGATADEIARREIDVGVGTFFSNMMMFFIILTTALTLNRHGLTHLETSRQVAEALEPLAGRFSSLLYTIGLLGTGALAIPTLAGSAGYACAELFGWRQGIDERFTRARSFYLVLVLSIVAGIGLSFTSVNPVKAMYWAAVLNGILAPFLLTGILLVASDRVVMRGQPSNRLGRGLVLLTTIAMFGASIAMFVV